MTGTVSTMPSTDPAVVSSHAVPNTALRPHLGLIRDIIRLTNDFRRENGLSTVTLHVQMCNAGLSHAVKMSTGERKFNHDFFDQRVTLESVGFVGSKFCENIAFCGGTANVAKTMVDGWIKSPGHRANLLSDTRFCGVAIAERGGQYWSVQIFGR